MIFTSETTIDLDEKRRIWIQLTADGDGEPSGELIENMAKTASKQALDTYNQVKVQVTQGSEKRFGAERPPDRPKPIGVK